MLLRADMWLREFKEDHGATRTLRLAFQNEEEIAPSWDVPVSSFAFRSGGTLLKNDNSFLHLAQAKLKFENVVTLLNSGNIIFDAIADDPGNLEQTIASHLEKVFGFPIPTIMNNPKIPCARTPVGPGDGARWRRRYRRVGAARR